MGCSDITNGIGIQCKKLQAGNQRIYMFNYLEDPFTVVDGVATGISDLLTTAYEFKIKGGGHILEQNMASDRNTGTTINTQTITALLNGITADKNATLNILIKGYPMLVIRDYNDNYHAVGIKEGIDFTGVSTTGGEGAEFNGYTLTGTSMTKDYAPILDSATVTAFLEKVTI